MRWFSVTTFTVSLGTGRTGCASCKAIVLGMTGTGKTTLLRNIISQDLARVVGPPDEPHRLPMVIFDGKGDLEFF